MSSSARLKYMVQSSLLNNDLAGARDAFNQWQIANCYYPQDVRTFDAHTQTWRNMKVPCGSCYHCMETKINEWCTRMYAHAEDFKNVYFVTLTYRSFTNVSLPVNKLILSKLQHAIWHLDSKNYYNKLCFSPCLLVKDHYQKFLKRLRKNTGFNDITYVLSGEYGHDFGRPHFHMILFTNHTLTYDDIRRAWSVCLWRNNDGSFVPRRNQKYNGVAYDFPIGKVDFHDLVSNGSFNTHARVRVDGTYMSAVNCFAYVCKYVCKRDNANLNRVIMAYNSLFVKKTFCKVYNKDAEIFFIKSYLQQMGYSHSNISNLIKQYSYEKTCFLPRSIFADSSLSQFCDSTLYGQAIKVVVYPDTLADFKFKYRPFCEFSRSTPIGSLYATRHLSEFAEGVFNQPTLQTSGFVVPSYFRRKVQDYYFGLKQPKRSLRCDSLVLGGLQDLYRRFSCSLEDGSSLREYSISRAYNYDVKSSLRSPHCHFHDTHTGERIIFDESSALHYKFDRHQRKYVHTRSVPVADWIRYWCSKLQAEFVRHDLQLKESERNSYYRDDAFALLQESISSIPSLRDSFVENSKQAREAQQKLYFDMHYNVE